MSQSIVLAPTLISKPKKAFEKAESMGLKRILLLMPVNSYRARDFLEAGQQPEIEVIVGSNHRPVLEKFSANRSLTLALEPIDGSVARISAYARRYPLHAILGTDQETGMLAASAAQALGLAHNPPAAVAAAHDKYRFRCVLAASALPSPWFQLIALQQDLAAAAVSVNYPCVLKPRTLSASRGVIRVDNQTEFIAACTRIEAILHSAGLNADSILAEAFIPGREFALEGLLNNGHLQMLALFDKPDPLDGPFFEETIYVTPSRLPPALQQRIIRQTAAAAAALGLRHGPVHAELRVHGQEIYLLELAARSIGGLCSRALVFGQGLTLEALILRHAAGLPVSHFKREQRAAGVMMIPIPGKGRLRSISGLDEARAVSGVEALNIGVAVGESLLPLPEAERYPGFIFARAGTPQDVESALREAHRRLYFELDMN